jgi:hypothetical protein
MKIIRFTINDTLELKKNHPCGSRQFSVLRIGGDVRIRCIGCGHDLVVERVKLEKSIRKVIPGAQSEDSESLTEP